MADHTRTENIGGDSINFCGHPCRAENRYDTYFGMNKAILRVYIFIHAYVRFHFSKYV